MKVIGPDLKIPGQSGVERPEAAKPADAGKLKPTGSQPVPFSDFLEERLRGLGDAKTAPQEIKFSAHAQTRMTSRGIEMSPEDLIKLQDAVAKVREKGSKESLVLTDKAAFVVSVKNNTVITAVDRESLKENVFTNIDSTVMI